MKTVIKLDKTDIINIIAERFQVPPNNVYLWTSSYEALGGGTEYDVYCEIEKDKNRLTKIMSEMSENL